MSDGNNGETRDDGRTAKGQFTQALGRWRPGQSGNPKGRPLSRPFKASFDRILRALEPDDPERALDKLNAAMYAKAVNGDVAAYKELADRYEGKVPNPIGGTDELPPITAFAWKSSPDPLTEAEAVKSITDIQKDDKAIDD